MVHAFARLGYISETQYWYKVMGMARKTDSDIVHVLNNYIDFCLNVGK